jgi:hypothetical protein
LVDRLSITRSCPDTRVCDTTHPRQSLLNMNPAEFRYAGNQTAFILFHIVLRESPRPPRTAERHSPNISGPWAVICQGALFMHVAMLLMYFRISKVLPILFGRGPVTFLCAWLGCDAVTLSEGRHVRRLIWYSPWRTTYGRHVTVFWASMVIWKLLVTAANNPQSKWRCSY